VQTVVVIKKVAIRDLEKEKIRGNLIQEVDLKGKINLRTRAKEEEKEVGIKKNIIETKGASKVVQGLQKNALNARAKGIYLRIAHWEREKRKRDLPH
jgi:hypothetical protein